ncbi:hypothetical protein [Tropicimonas aquimaris]|uniref:Uncharacterized protein n=1 Tax=Tropicimonas aquimaris TaxID=914152 RepID=A0ABW3IRY8_9RHOB
MTDTSKPGRAPRLVVAQMMAVISGLLVLAFIFQDSAAMADAQPGLAGAITFQLVAQALGGFIVGWILAGLFGRPGLTGWMLSLAMGVLATVLAGLLGGIIKSVPRFLSEGFELGELVTVAASALAGPLAFDRNPVLAVIWVGLLLLTHIVAARERGQTRTI